MHEHVLVRGRQAFLRQMRGRCLVERPGVPVEDGEGGVDVQYQVVGPPETPCYVRYPGLAYETNIDSSGLRIAQSRVVLRVPFGTVYRVGDRVTIVSDPDNPQLVSTVYRVASIDDMSQATAQRLLCEDNQAGV